MPPTLKGRHVTVALEARWRIPYGWWPPCVWRTLHFGRGIVLATRRSGARCSRRAATATMTMGGLPCLPPSSRAVAQRCRNTREHRLRPWVLSVESWISRPARLTYSMERTLRRHTKSSKTASAWISRGTGQAACLGGASIWQRPPPRQTSTRLATGGSTACSCAAFSEGRHTASWKGMPRLSRRCASGSLGSSTPCSATGRLLWAPTASM
mmetsp:Transcript_99489/g.222023  ORF Transcript_99489/g.222023 Transcript_99489/m.222023 type:complete len:211 (-) Transcript_99489:305-937(-)